jgi:hypothetical protein
MMASLKVALTSPSHLLVNDKSQPKPKPRLKLKPKTKAFKPMLNQPKSLLIMLAKHLNSNQATLPLPMNPSWRT